MNLKTSLKRAFFWAFIIVLSISFIAYFGLTGDTLGGNTSGTTIGKVDGRSIKGDRNSYYYDVFQELNAYYTSIGYTITAENQELLARQAFYEVAAQEVVGELAKSSFYTATADQLVNFLKNDYFDGSVERWNEFVTLEDKAIRRGIEEKAFKLYQRRLYENSAIYSLPLSHRRVTHYIDLAKVSKTALVASIDGDTLIERYATEEKLKQYYNSNTSRYTKQAIANEDVPTEETAVQEEIEIPPEDLLSFEEVYETVYEDYLLENRASIEQEIVSEIVSKISSAIAKVNSLADATISNKADVFTKEFSDENYYVLETEPVNFFSQQVSFVGGNTVPLRGEAIQSIMATKQGTASFAESSSLIFHAFLIIDEKKSSFRDDNELYLQYASQLKNGYYQSLRKQFYEQVFDGKEIEFNGSQFDF